MRASPSLQALVDYLRDWCFQSPQTFPRAPPSEKERNILSCLQHHDPLLDSTWDAYLQTTRGNPAHLTELIVAFIEENRHVPPVMRDRMVDLLVKITPSHFQGLYNDYAQTPYAYIVDSMMSVLVRMEHILLFMIHEDHGFNISGFRPLVWEMVTQGPYDAIDVMAMRQAFQSLERPMLARLRQLVEIARHAQANPRTSRLGKLMASLILVFRDALEHFIAVCHDVMED